jgi:hypothetical protein
MARPELVGAVLLEPIQARIILRFGLLVAQVLQVGAAVAQRVLRALSQTKAIRLKWLVMFG